MQKLKDIPMHSSWQKILKEEFEKSYMKELDIFLENQSEPVFPPREKIFQALTLTPFEDVKVILLGQDPYHGEKQAEGLCFSVPKEIPLPPSLKNIFKELENDLNIPPQVNGSLVSWAKQGVLLLNTTLTVKKDLPNSHFGRGWETFTDTIISHVCKKLEPLVFILWGSNASKKLPFIKAANHSNLLILSAPHPSPLSAYRGFFGSKPFSKTNEFLKKNSINPITWAL